MTYPWCVHGDAKGLRTLSISEKWQQECMVRSDMEFLNHGTLAPTVKCAYEAATAAYLEWMHNGPGASLELREGRGYLNMMEEQDKCRRKVADWLGTNPESVALQGNVTDGINSALNSFTWQAGDRILTSNEEHEALRHPLRQLQKKFGVEIDKVAFPQRQEDVPQFFEELRGLLQRPVKLLAISEVSHKTGVRLDVGEIVRACATQPDTFVLIDSAHAAGTTPKMTLDGIDFCVFPGHKWLFGPVETGVLWVSPRALRETEPLMSGSPMISAEGVRYENLDGAWRFEYGTRDWSKFIGLAKAIEFRQQWSEEEIVAHYHSLGAAFKAAFESASGHKLMGVAPLYTVPTNHPGDIANYLWQTERVLVKPQDGNIRISLPPWLDETRAERAGRLFGEAFRHITEVQGSHAVNQ